MSNRIAVFNDGRIEQVGTPADLYEKLAAAQSEYARRSGNRFSGQKFTIELHGGRLSVKPTAFVALTLAQRRDGSTHTYLRSDLFPTVGRR